MRDLKKALEKAGVECAVDMCVVEEPDTRVINGYRACANKIKLRLTTFQNNLTIE